MAEDEDDRIPAAQIYKGVRIHDRQDAARIRIVKRAIDKVHALSSVEGLFEHLRDVRQPPESRLFAAAKLESLHALSIEKRNPIGIDVNAVSALAAGLDSVTWRDPSAYCSLLEDSAGAVPREAPLDDD